MKTPTLDLKFIEIPINLSGSPQVFKFFHVVDNGESAFVSGFKKLDTHTQKNLKSLMVRIASSKTYASDQFKRQLRGRSYGELKPHGHRFFIFQGCGDNYIIFAYSTKRDDSLGSARYRQLEQQKDYYAQKFEEFYQRNR